jgi:outer membrane autotransporter protein
MTVHVKEGYGFNLRPYLSLSKNWGIYAKLGRQFGSQETTLRQSAFQQTTSTTYAHTIYGLGISFNIDAQWGIGADYTRSKRIPSEQTNSSLISVGLRYKF